MTILWRAARAIERADRTVTHRAARDRDTPAMRVVATVAELADQPPMLAMIGTTLAVAAARRDARLGAAGARMLASHLLATAIKDAVKRRIDRTRPNAAEGGGRYRWRVGDDDRHEETSFPSGHTAGAVAVAYAVARAYPAAAPGAAAAAVTAGALQLPIGKHYGLDVLAGAVIGVVAEAAVNAAATAAGQAIAARSASPRSVRSHGK